MGFDENSSALNVFSMIFALTRTFVGQNYLRDNVIMLSLQR